MSQEYETVCILQPDLNEARHEKIRERVKKILDENKVELAEQKDWGKRKLAYPMGKFTFGHYLYFNFTGKGNFIQDLERTLKYEEGVMRYMTVKVPKLPAKAKKVTDPEEAGLVEDQRSEFREFRE